MADEILKRSAIERSFDNLTIVIVSFKNILTFYDQARKKQTKPSQAIKIEGETQSPRRTSNNNRVGGSLASRAKNEGASGPSAGNNISGSAGHQGFTRRKLKSLKMGLLLINSVSLEQSDATKARMVNLRGLLQERLPLNQE